MFPASVGRAQKAIDAFVQAAHDRPAQAIEMLRVDEQIGSARSSWGETGIQAASHLGHRRLICRLIECGVEADVFAAAALADHAAVRSMLPSTSRDACGVHELPLLHFGVMSRDVAMLETLIDSGVSLSPPSASLSPLHSAVAIGSEAMVRSLLTAGASLTASDAFGATALDWACQLEPGESKLVGLLVAAEAGGSALTRAGGAGSPAR